MKFRYFYNVTATRGNGHSAGLGSSVVVEIPLVLSEQEAGKRIEQAVVADVRKEQYPYPTTRGVSAEFDETGWDIRIEEIQYLGQVEADDAQTRVETEKDIEDRNE
jgi:hypothetical protein